MINSTNIGTWVDAAISQGDCLVRGRFAEDFVRSQRGAFGRVLKLAHRVAAPVGTGPGAESGYQRGAFGRRQRVRPLRRPRQTQGHVHLLWAARTMRPLATITVATC